MPAKKQTAKKTKRSSKRGPLQKIHHMVTENFEVSAVMVSVFVNIFFLTGFVLYHTSSSFENKVYHYTADRFCSQRNESISRAQYNVMCAKGDFKPYIEKAIDDYKSEKLSAVK